MDEKNCNQESEKSTVGNQSKFNLTASEVLNKMISEDNQLFLNLANKYSPSCTFVGDKEDLYHELICKVYDIYNSQEISRFETYNDFRNFLITSLKNYCLNLVIFSERHSKKESNEIPEDYSFTYDSPSEFKGLTEREKYLIEVFDYYDCRVYENHIKKWSLQRLLNLICVELAKIEGTDPHYILREYKVLAAKL